MIIMKKNDDELINSLYKKLNSFKKEGLTITKKEVKDFFTLLINKN